MSSIKQRVFDKLDKDGYINDNELYELYGKEPNFASAEEYKRQWRRLQADRDFFSDKEITHAHKGGKTRAMVDTPDGSYIVGKEFFEEVISDMVEDNSRPDLKTYQMYRKK